MINLWNHDQFRSPRIFDARHITLVRDLAGSWCAELSLLTDRNGPQLAAPDVNVLLELASVSAPNLKDRADLMEAMRTAAGKRVAGVTENKRRRHYGHAASVALVSAEVDDSPEGAQWLAAIREEYRRYPALQRELRQAR